VKEIELHKQFTKGVLFDRIARIWFTGLTYFLVVVALSVAAEITGSQLLQGVYLFSGFVLLLWFQERAFNAMIWVILGRPLSKVQIRYLTMALAVVLGLIVHYIALPVLSAMILAGIEAG